MPDQSLPLDLIRLIHCHLNLDGTSSPGVCEVLSGIDRHLANPSSAVMANPALPAEREDLLDHSLACVTEPTLQSLVKSLGQVRNQLAWRIDYGLFYSKEADVGDGYLSGNLHAELIGPNGCVFRDDDFSLGLFLLSPATLYRDHCHAAPELYLNLTGPCGWRFDRGSWQELNAGSIVWNPSGIPHAMRTCEQPFLSVYSWTENVSGLCRVVSMDDWPMIEAQLANVRIGT